MGVCVGGGLQGEVEDREVIGALVVGVEGEVVVVQNEQLRQRGQVQ